MHDGSLIGKSKEQLEQLKQKEGDLLQRRQELMEKEADRKMATAI